MTNGCERTGKLEKRKEIDPKTSAGLSGPTSSKIIEERMSERVEQFRLSNGNGERVPEERSDALEGLLESGSSVGRNNEIMKAKSY